MNLPELLTERPRESGERLGAVAYFMGLLDGLTWAQARAKLRDDARMHRWNAATQGAILRALRAHYEGAAR